MRIVTLALFALVLGFVVVASCRAPIKTEPEPATTDPILAVGHGAFIGADGKEVRPNRDFIQSAQQHYISTILKSAATGDTPKRLDDARIQQIRKLIYDRVKDNILANGIFLDWLIEEGQPEDSARLTIYGNALRWYYYLHILDNRRPEENTWHKGLDPETADELDRNGVPTTVYLKTTAGGAEYRGECREAGVPVPDAMFSAEWALQGTFDNEFISTSSQAELWLFESTSPQGACLALPRYPASGGGFSNEAELLGIICLGTVTNKTCFFDNPRGRTFTRGVEVSINEFVGGADLVANGQGVCSDCHAGENPYVVHPEKPAFAGLPNLQPSGWPDPLVVASWPQNPGPTNLLDAVSSTGQCDSCHRVGSAGRFPEVSTELPGYCNVVLATAIGTSPRRTMPPFGMDRSLFTAHINALVDACGDPPTGGGVVVEVDVPDDPGFISPPIIVDPCYQCAEQVAVRGAILDAKLELSINGTAVGSRIVRSIYREDFNTPPLVAGDILTATQEFGGVVSAPSVPVTVRDHTVDYPSGIPTPEVDPVLIHECGDIIAVRHIPGARITVFTNGTVPSSRSTSTDWSAVFPGKRPFDVGDAFTAQAELCGDVSPTSPAATAIAAPTSLPAPTLDPATVFAGQELVAIENITHGARVSLTEASFGPVGDFTWPVSWFPDYDVASQIGGPLSAGDQLITIQKLCTEGPRSQTPPAVGCDELPAPRIRHPRVGDVFVVVTESVPGARIRVYDATGDELGDGAGTVIALKRAITGADTLTIVQQLGECTSSTGYVVSVRNPKSSTDG